MNTELKDFNLYLHTHWDREWYLPFETYRAQLVAVVKQVLSQLESGELPNFLLDGQSCVLEDVLLIEPQLEPRIVRLMSEDKLAAGPWYVLADQLLVSGESLVRNMKIGLDATRKLGSPAMIGYCPDTLGHTADMPRILQGFAIDTPSSGGACRKWPDLLLLNGLVQTEVLCKRTSCSSVTTRRRFTTAKRRRADSTSRAFCQ